MSTKSILEALAEVQRKVNEQKTKNAEAIWQEVTEGGGQKAMPKKPAEPEREYGLFQGKPGEAAIQFSRPKQQPDAGANALDAAERGMTQVKPAQSAAPKLPSFAQQPTPSASSLTAPRPAAAPSPTSAPVRPSQTPRPNAAPAAKAPAPVEPYRGAGDDGSPLGALRSYEKAKEAGAFSSPERMGLGSSSAAPKPAAPAPAPKPAAPKPAPTSPAFTAPSGPAKVMPGPNVSNLPKADTMSDAGEKKTAPTQSPAPAAPAPVAPEKVANVINTATNPDASTVEKNKAATAAGLSGDEDGGKSKGKKKVTESALINAFFKLHETKAGNIFEAAKKAKKDYDGDGKIESPKDEVWGSRFKAAKKAGKMEEGKVPDNWEENTPATRKKTVNKNLAAEKVPGSKNLKMEEIEQVDEISKQLALRHNQAAGDQRDRAMKGDMPKANPHSSKKRPTLQRHLDGMKMSYDKLTGNAKVPATGELDELTGIKKSPMKKIGYVMKAGEVMTKTAPHEIANNPETERKFKNRLDGLQNLQKRMAKEEAEQIDEISKKTAMSAYQSATFVDSEHPKADAIRGHIEKKWGKEMGKHADAHAYLSNYPRHNPFQKDDELERAKPASSMRMTSAGKIHKQDIAAKKSEIKSRMKEEFEEVTFSDAELAHLASFEEAVAPQTDKDSADVNQAPSSSILDEAGKRGRPSKKDKEAEDPNAGNGRDPRQHIQVIAGQAGAGRVMDFKHNDGSVSKITPPMGRAIVAKLNGMKPADRHAAVNKMHDSAEGLKG
jgi:hypothetical protein